MEKNSPESERSETHQAQAVTASVDRESWVSMAVAAATRSLRQTPSNDAVFDKRSSGGLSETSQD